jgi:hypothetical protein
MLGPISIGVATEDGIECGRAVFEVFARETLIE